MLSKLPIHDAVDGLMLRRREQTDHLDPHGFFHIEHIRDGAVIAEFDVLNAVTNQAKNDILNSYFKLNGTQSNWYIGLIDNASFTAQSAGDTASSHSGWNEFTAYTYSSGGNRGSWTQGTPAGQAITNASAVVFDFTGAGTVWGILVQSDPTKSGTSGILWSTAPFNAPLAVSIGDQLKVTYTVQL